MAEYGKIMNRKEYFKEMAVALLLIVGLILACGVSEYLVR